MILLLSTSDTDLLSARASGAEYRLGNPARTGVEGSLSSTTLRASLASRRRMTPRVKPVSSSED